MLGLGSSLYKSGKITPGVIRDGLVLKHDYVHGSVEPCSTGAVYLDGAGDDDYIDIGNQANLNMSTGSFSVSCWVYSNHHSTPTTRFVLGKGDNASTASSTGYALYLGNSGTDWIFSVGDGTDYKASQTTVGANYNQWYHVCGTFDGTAKTLKLYIDGVLIDTDTDTDIGDIDNTTAFQIGRIAASTSNTWDGYICNVGVWKGVALTQPQIKSIMHKNYAALSDSEKTNLVSWWNLDSVIPASATQSPQTVAVYDNHYGGGSELGSELWDSPWSTDGSTDDWSVYDVNTVSTVNGALQITHGGGSSGDHAAGANLYLRNSTILSEDLVVGSVYKIVYDIKVNTGTVTVMINDGSSNTQSLDVSSSNYVTQVIYFKRGTGVPYFKLGHDLAAGQVVTLDNFSLKKVNGNIGTLS